MNIHFLQHEIFEAPGAYLNWALSRSHEISFSRMYEYEPLPDDISHIDLLVIMGGPQSPDTTTAECPHFDAAAEMRLILKAVNSGKAVIGVCLGAQLIGQALGASYEHSPEKEIGVLPMTLTAAGLKDDKISHFGSSVPVGHWHSDMPGLTPECSILATTVGCPRQIIRYSSMVYGFQCHMELTPEVVGLLIAEEEQFLLHNTEHRFVQSPDTIRAFDFEDMNQRLYVFLDKLEASVNRQRI